MNADVAHYHASLSEQDRAICDMLHAEISAALPDAESKIWHAHPVWFLDGNPIVGYHPLKRCVRLLFWSGQSFDEPGLTASGTFKAAEARYTYPSEVDLASVRGWLVKSRAIQWDYKNIRKRRGVLALLEAP